MLVWRPERVWEHAVRNATVDGARSRVPCQFERPGVDGVDGRDIETPRLTPENPTIVPHIHRTGVESQTAHFLCQQGGTPRLGCRDEVSKTPSVFAMIGRLCLSAHDLAGSSAHDIIELKPWCRVINIVRAERLVGRVLTLHSSENVGRG